MEHEHHHDSPVEDEEINFWKKKLTGAWIFGIPVMILMLITRIFQIEIINEQITLIIFLVLAFPVVFIFGFSTLKSSISIWIL